MSLVKTEVGQVEATLTLFVSSHGGTNTALPGANTQQEPSETLAAGKFTPSSLKLVKEENEEGDDLLTHLAVLFGQVMLGDSSPADSHEVRREEELASPPDSQQHASLTSPDEGCSTPKANPSNLCPDSSPDSLQQANRAGALPSPITTNNHEQSRELPSLVANEPNLTQNTPTSSVPDLEVSIGESPSECEGTRETLSDTHTERADSAPSTPKDGASVLPGSIKEEENDDPLACLADKMAGTTLDDRDDTCGGVRPERPEDEMIRPSPAKLEIDDKSLIKTEVSSVPPTPHSKAVDNYYYFYAPSGLYYFDNYHNVYFHDSTLVHDGSDVPDSGDLLAADFCLDEIPFWFDDEGLLFQGVDGNLYRADVNCIREAKRKAMEDEPLQAYPTKAEINNNKYCFCASGRLYYFDSNRRLFSQHGKLVYDGSSSFTAYQSFLPNFYIDGVAYWFEPYGLWARGADSADSACYPVHTWLSKPESLGQLPSPDQRPISKNRRVASALVPNPALHGDLNAVPTTISDFDATCSTTPKVNSCSPTAKADSLQQALRGNVDLTFSPSSSSNMSSSPFTAAGLQLSEKHPESLFLASEPNYIQHLPAISESQDRIVQPQIITEKALAGKKQRGEEHRRCPYCLKVFRRPCALAEHVNTHTGEKPHKCPFVSCNTGFATRQNMRRHFLTHQAGEIDQYTPGMTQGSTPKKRRKAEVDTLPLNSNDSFIGRIRL